MKTEQFIMIAHFIFHNTCLTCKFVHKAITDAVIKSEIT